MNVLYIPLDERPCNYKYPQLIAGMTNQMQLVVPPVYLLGEKKRAADIDLLWEWIYRAVPQCEAAIISIEMLIYGGLLPSRIHTLSEAECLGRLEKIKELKDLYPKLCIYGFNLIMRTPTYNSSEEEPDYYETHGENIFQYGRLMDLKERVGLTQDEQKELDEIIETTNKEFITDYCERRSINIKVTEAVVETVQEGIIDFLSMPQDDSAPYGFTAIDQRKIIEMIGKRRLYDVIHMYPGADEVGCTLLARVYNIKNNRMPKIYVFYSSTLGAQITPKYEDRPFGESVKSHILAVGGLLVDTAHEADFVIAINSAGKIMQESWEQQEKDVTYASYRNLREFVQKIAYYISQNKKCVVADVSFSNGGDHELIHMLDQKKLLDKIGGYAGWNTACNTLGTVIAMGIMGLEGADQVEVTKNLVYRILEDWGYQAHARQHVIQNFLPKIGASYYDFVAKDEEIHGEMKHVMQSLWQDNIVHTFKDYQIQIQNVYTPWNRMFEIGMELLIEKRD